MNTVIIQTTCATVTEAKNIAKVLIEDKLAACIQLSEVESLYMWNNEFCCDNETLMNIKTRKENFEKVKSKIKELHSYDVPEIIQLDITNASKKYIKFIGENTNE
jgi:periplasmic divalent cation tolerance protein